MFPWDQQDAYNSCNLNTVSFHMHSFERAGKSSLKLKNGLYWRGKIKMFYFNGFLWKTAWILTIRILLTLWCCSDNGFKRQRNKVSYHKFWDGSYQHNTIVYTNLQVMLHLCEIFHAVYTGNGTNKVFWIQSLTKCLECLRAYTFANLGKMQQKII